MKKNYILFIALFMGVFGFNSEVFATTYYSKATGNLNAEANWGTNTDGTGTTPIAGSFSDIVAHTFIITNRASFNHNVSWTLNAAKTVVIGNGVSAINLIISGINGKIQGANIQILNTATLTISKNNALPSSSFIVLDNASTVVYNVAGTTVIPATYGNLTINQNAVAAANISVNTILSITASRTFNVSGQILDLNGTIDAATGSLITNNGTDINFYNTSAMASVGTLKFNTNPATVKNLNISFGNATAFVTLGSSLLIQDNGSGTSYFNYDNGGIDLAANSVTVDATSDANFPAATTDGFIRGSASSALFLNGTIGIASGGNSTLAMDQTSSASRSLKVLSVNNAGAALIVGNNLDIIDSLSVLNGSVDLGGFVTLKSSASAKARLSRVGGTVTGNMKVETFIPGGSAGWNTIGPAGINGLTVTNWDGGSGSATGFAMTCSGCINNGTSAGGAFVSIVSDPAGNGVYTDLISSSALTPGTGYWVYIGSNLTSAIDITQTTTGPAVTGNVTNSTGFMSNPYASPISLASLQASNPGLTSLDVYNTNSGAYQSYNGGIPSDIIPMGQGFYTNGITSVTFQESNKTSSNNSMLKTATSIGSVFQLKIDGWYGDYDNTYVRFHNDATPAFDDLLDAYKRYATPGYAGIPGVYTQYTSIATVNASQDYAINSLPFALTADAVIPVLAKASGTGQYTISPIDIQNMPATSCVILKDKLLNINHDLRTGSYVFNMADTTSAPRFELTICSGQFATSIKQTASNSTNVLIGQDGAAGVFVKTAFDKNTKSVISAYNVMGQKIIADKEIEGTENLVYLDFKDLHNQIVIIKVTNEKGQTTKKVFLN